MDFGKRKKKEPKTKHKHSQAPENNKIKVKDFHNFPSIPNRMSAIAFNFFALAFFLLLLLHFI